MRKLKHRRALDAATTALLQGNPQPLLDLLDHAPPRDTIETERQALDDISQRLSQHFRPGSAGRRPAHSIGPAAIAALQRLRQRAQQRRSSQKVKEALRRVVVGQSGDLVHDDFTNHIAQVRHEIGDLPRVWLGPTKSKTHLLGPTGRSYLCGTNHQSNAVSAVARGEVSILSHNVSCAGCLKALKQGQPCRTYSPDQWFVAWQQDNKKHYGLYRLREARSFARNQPPPSATVEEIKALVIQARSKSFCRRLERHGRGVPKSLIHP